MAPFLHDSDRAHDERQAARVRADAYVGAPDGDSSTDCLAVRFRPDDRSGSPARRR